MVKAIATKNEDSQLVRVRPFTDLSYERERSAISPGKRTSQPPSLERCNARAAKINGGGNVSAPEASVQ